jgi:hypothetical protein
MRPSSPASTAMVLVFPASTPRTKDMKLADGDWKMEKELWRMSGQYTEFLRGACDV